MDGFIGTTNETFYSFSGGNNDPDKETLNKLRPGDNIDPNNLFEYILNGYGRSSTAKGLDGMFQFGIDMASLGSFGSKNDSTWISSTIYDPYPHDTIKKVLENNRINEQKRLDKSADSLNEVNYRKSWHYKKYGW